MAESLMFLARCYRRARKYAEAEALCKRAIQILDRPGTPTHPSLISVLRFYSRLLREMNREAEAKQVEARIHELHKQLSAPDSTP
jgi:tetratricopeptide (TPR) repeat protein